MRKSDRVEIDKLWDEIMNKAPAKPAEPEPECRIPIKQPSEENGLGDLLGGLLLIPFVLIASIFHAVFENKSISRAPAHPIVEMLRGFNRMLFFVLFLVVVLALIANLFS